MKTSETGKPVPAEEDFASASVLQHLLRGVVGFGAIIGSIALVPFVGPATLLAAPLGLVALRGCPACWMIGLAQTVSRGRLERSCTDGVCTLTTAGGSAAIDRAEALGGGVTDHVDDRLGVGGHIP